MEQEVERWLHLVAEEDCCLDFYELTAGLFTSKTLHKIKAITTGRKGLLKLHSPLRNYLRVTDAEDSCFSSLYFSFFPMPQAKMPYIHVYAATLIVIDTL